jgi:hypothetical protein
MILPSKSMCVGSDWINNARKLTMCVPYKVNVVLTEIQHVPWLSRKRVMPPLMKSRSVGEHNSPFTRLYGRYIELVLMASKSANITGELWKIPWISLVITIKHLVKKSYGYHGFYYKNPMSSYKIYNHRILVKP